MDVRDIERLARYQHGLVTRPQLLALDLSDAEVEGLLRRRYLVRVRQGVYRLAGAPDRFPMGAMAATLAYGSAWASHGTAARLLNLPGFESNQDVVITVPRGRSQGLKGVRIFESRLLPKDQCWTTDKVPCLSIGRTICDLAGELDSDKLVRLVDNCLVRRKIKLDALQATFEALDRPGRKGRAKLRRLLTERDKGGGLPESELEARFLTLLAKHGVARPVLQWTPPWLEHLNGRVDCAYPDNRQIFELDGRPWHLRDTDRERDLRRDHAAALAGWLVTRFSWRQVVHAGDYVIEVVAGMLASAGQTATAQTSTG